jgi:uncharacterized membrane protein
MNDKTKEHIEDLYETVKQQARLIETQYRYINSLEIDNLVKDKKIKEKFDNTRYVKLFQKMELELLQLREKVAKKSRVRFFRFEELV